MFGMSFINPEDLPPGVREQIEKQHDLHHMHHQQHIHEVNGFFDSLTKEQLITLSSLIQLITDGTADDNERGAYYLGRVSQHLMIKYGVCICGVDHDAELKGMANEGKEEGQNLPGAPEAVVRDLAENAPSRSEAHEMLERHVRKMGADGGWSEAEIAAAVADGKRMLDDLNKNVAAEPPMTFTDHQGIMHTWINGEWVATPQDLAPAPTEPQGEAREALLKKYNVLDNPIFPKVSCAKGCGTTWISLADRMRRAPDECGGCQQRSAWG
jgi:hypothetical protein